MQGLSKKNIFVSYTTIDYEINKNTLIDIEKILIKYGKVYIDLLHNNNVSNPQKKVFEELYNSNILIVINTSNINKSKWAILELENAKKRNIQILFLSVTEILTEHFQI